MNRLTVDIVSPYGHIWSGHASHVRAPSVSGHVGILPGRQPLVAILGTGDAHVTPVGRAPFTIAIEEGLVFVDHDHVTLLPENHIEPIADQ